MLQLSEEDDFLPEAHWKVDENFTAGDPLDQNMAFGEAFLPQSYPCGVSG